MEFRGQKMVLAPPHYAPPPQNRRRYLGVFLCRFLVLEGLYIFKPLRTCFYDGLGGKKQILVIFDFFRHGDTLVLTLLQKMKKNVKKWSKKG